MKKIILPILMLILLAMTGCGDTNNKIDLDTFPEDDQSDEYFDVIDLGTIEIDESSSSLIDLDGRWNFKGMPSDEAEKFIYFDGMNFKYGLLQFDEESIRNEGTYEWVKGKVSFFIGDPIEYLYVETDADLSFRLSEDQLILIGGFWDDDYFLREDVIGTPEGKEALLKVNLFAGSPWLSDKSIMHFVENGMFLYNSIEAATNQAWRGDEDGGTWEFEGDILILKWKDGTEDRGTLMENSFEVESLQEKFNN